MKEKKQRSIAITRALFYASVSLYFILFSNIGFCNSVNILQQVKANEIVSVKGEVIVQFRKPSSISIEKLSKIIYIDRIKNDTVRAYITKNQIENFLQTRIDFEVIEKPLKIENSKLFSSIHNFDKYPTYQEYVSLLDSFARTFPAICSKIEIGKSVKGKSILFIRINSDTLVPKPSVMYSSTMHGDETGGYVMMLHLIDYLINNYKNNSLVTKLIDSLDIWINPLANPDGTYAGGNNSVLGATRTNANGADLNRNFPDPLAGNHPDGMQYQPENIEMMNFMKKYHISLSANFHAGDEVVNYPWDCDSILHVDADWFKNISAEYADSAQHYGRSTYFTDVTSKGIVDGIYWYVVNGGRQDYITNFLQGREVTIELDVNKITPESDLLNLWNYNYRSFLHYIEQALYGIHGFVTDSVSGKPIRAKIEVEGHDNDSSVVYSDSNNAAYYRFIAAGTYDLKITANGYNPQVIKNVQVNNRQTTYLNILLTATKINVPDNSKYPEISIYPNPANNFLFIKLENNTAASIEIFDILGRKTNQIELVNHGFPINISKLNPGLYFIKVQIQDKILIKTFAVVR